MAEPRMLDGVTVLGLASVGPAARACRWLSDYGAEVVEVGPVPSRQGVQITPPFHAYGGRRGMKRALFDLKAPAGRDALLGLAATADVVVESFRPGVVARLGIGYEQVRAVNERIVYCSTSGYGQTGPRAGWAGHDLNYLAVGGFLACTGPGEEGGPPLPGATIADSAGGGMHAVMAILAALVRRERTGRGAYLDVAVADGVLAFMSLVVDEYLATGERPGPGHDILTGRYACYDLYPCRDGNWLSVAAIEPAFFENLCRALGLVQWIDHQTDDDVQDEIRADLRRVLRTRDRDEWIADLAPADTCVAPVQSVPEVVDDEQFAGRDAFAEARHTELGIFPQVAPLLAGCERPTSPSDLPDPAATDTDDLLRRAGLSAEEVERLRRDGVVA